VWQGNFTCHTRFDDPFVRWTARIARIARRTDAPSNGRGRAGNAPTRAVGRDTTDRAAGRPLGIRETPSLSPSRFRMSFVVTQRVQRVPLGTAFWSQLLNG
jgi:hypothetical protein